MMQSVLKVLLWLLIFFSLPCLCGTIESKENRREEKEERMKKKILLIVQVTKTTILHSNEKCDDRSAPRGNRSAGYMQAVNG